MTRRHSAPGLSDADTPPKPPSGQTLAAIVKDILEGRLGFPANRDEAILRFGYLVDQVGITNKLAGYWCGVSEATAKRWRRRHREGRPFDDGRRVSVRERAQKKREAQGKEPLPPPPITTASLKGAARAKWKKGYRKGLKGEDGEYDTKELLKKSDEDLADIFSREEIPPDYDAIRILKKISLSSATARPLKVATLRIIAAHENQRGRIPWESIKLNEIPVETQHRLAGMLLPLIAWNELPEEVRQASPARRRVYKLLGVLPITEETAAETLERWANFAAAERQRLSPVVAETNRPPLVVRFAVEAGRTAPK